MNCARCNKELAAGAVLHCRDCYCFVAQLKRVAELTTKAIEEDEKLLTKLRKNLAANRKLLTVMESI